LILQGKAKPVRGVDRDHVSKYGIAKPQANNIVNKIKEKPLFQIQLHNSIAGSLRFYYEGLEISSLSLEELKNLMKNLDLYFK
jgi:hypothetical protein